MSDFDICEQPSGDQLKAFRESIVIDGKECTQDRMADSIGVRVGTYRTWEQEAYGRRCPALEWAMIRITWDDDALAEWKDTRPSGFTRSRSRRKPS